MSKRIAMHGNGEKTRNGIVCGVPYLMMRSSVVVMKETVMKNIKMIALALVLCLTMAALTACGGGREFTPNGNGMYVSKDGQFSTAFEEAVDQAYFTEADMLKFVEDEVKAYNKAKGASAAAYAEDVDKEETLPVAITSFTYGEKAQLILTYASAKDYLAFNEKDETAADELMFALAKNTTGMPDMTFVSVEDGSKIAAGSLVGESKLKIVMIVGQQNIQVQGKLVYVSENVTVTGEDTAITAESGYSYLVFK